MIYNVFDKKKKTTPISDVDVGSSVYCNVDGVRTEFIIVQKGNPNTSIYDSSCDGIWLMAKDLSDDSVIWYRNNSIYSSSIEVYTFCNETFYNKLSIKDIINDASIPVWKSSTSTTTAIKSSVFPLSTVELGLRGLYTNNTAGTKLQYFEYDEETTSANNKRIATYNGNAEKYWTRTINENYYYVYGVNFNGTITNLSSTASWRVRPCFIIPSDAKIDASGNILV